MFPGQLGKGKTFHAQRSGGVACKEGMARKNGMIMTTWISAPMIDAYRQLHRLGHAHSVEIWQDDQLQAGLYGLSLGRVFCGESMFSHIDNGAKLAMVALCRHFAHHGGALIDCQMQNPFLATLGVQEWPRKQFLSALTTLSRQPLLDGCWQARRISP